MSKRGLRNPKPKNETLLGLQPAILRRKRKIDGVERWEPKPEESIPENLLQNQALKECQECQDSNGQMSLVQSCGTSCGTVNMEQDKYPSPDNAKDVLPKCHRVPCEMDSAPTLGQYETVPCLSTPIACSKRISPLPPLKWANHQEVWDIMVQKEARYHVNPNMLVRHPALHSRMRAILLDWLIEVCEVYRLHRESFYLAQDYIDRYLTMQSDVQKQQLQLLGVTALFVAAKMEEIYPPKLSEFAYVTDGACTESEIMDQELVMLKVLNWDLTPVTVNSWLTIYLQLSKRLDRPQGMGGDAFLFPEYSNNIFIQVSQLSDLCMLDISCLQFSYSTIAASAVYHMTSEKTALLVSGLKWSDIATCVQWMVPFAMTVRENGCFGLKFFKQITSDDMHNIQTHSVDLHLLDKAQARRNQMTAITQNSPQNSPRMLTPPQSSEKST